MAVATRRTNDAYAVTLESVEKCLPPGGFAFVAIDPDAVDVHTAGFDQRQQATVVIGMRVGNDDEIEVTDAPGFEERQNGLRPRPAVCVGLLSV